MFVLDHEIFQCDLQLHRLQESLQVVRVRVVEDHWHPVRARGDRARGAFD